MKKQATDRIREIYNEIKVTTDWRNMGRIIFGRKRFELEMEILAIKRYLDEISGVNRA